MKKIIFSLLIINILLIYNYSFASTISGDGYVIDLPVTYQMISEGNYVASNGNSIMVTRYPTDGNVAKIYSKSFIKKFENYINTQYTETLKTELKNHLNKRKNSSLTSKEVDELVDSLDYIVKKREITKVSKNKYKCVHFLISASVEGLSDSNLDTYIIATSDKRYTSNNRIFMLMCVGSDVDSTEMKDIRNSFTITNYQKPTTTDYLINRYGFSVFYFGVSLVPIIGYIMYRRGQKKKY